MVTSPIHKRHNLNEMLKRSWPVVTFDQHICASFSRNTIVAYGIMPQTPLTSCQPRRIGNSRNRGNEWQGLIRIEKILYRWALKTRLTIWKLVYRNSSRRSSGLDLRPEDSLGLEFNGGWDIPTYIWDKSWALSWHMESNAHVPAPICPDVPLLSAKTKTKLSSKKR